MTPDARRELGAAGEAAVARWYEAAGYRVVDRNWRVREGEIDLVVEDRSALVFCEVKTRRSSRFGAPVEAVTPAKARRVRALAARWLAHHDGGGRPIRFDVASVTPGPGGDLVVEVLAGVF